MYYCISKFLWLHLWYVSVILLDIHDISMHFFIISLLSFHAENNPAQWYQSMLLLIVFQCMSPTRSEYRQVGSRACLSWVKSLLHTQETLNGGRKEKRQSRRFYQFVAWASSHMTEGWNDGEFFPHPSMPSDSIRGIFIKQPLWRNLHLLRYKSILIFLYLKVK